MDKSPTSAVLLSGLAICSGPGGALPRLYVLGQQKSGSTAISTILFQAGALPMVPFNQADAIRGHGHEGVARSYSQALWGAHADTLLQGNVKESNLLRGVKQPGCWSTTCLIQAKQKWEKKLSFFSNCSSWNTTLLSDMSTDNLHKPERAALLTSLYGPLAAHLMFVVILRKPVERFRSAFYWYYNSEHFGQQRDDKHRHAHNRTLAMEIALLSSTLPPTFGLVRTAWSELQTTALDTFTRTMYSLNWRPWLEQFEARQFVVFPMDYALQNVSRATSMVSTHFGVPLAKKAHIFNANKPVKTINPNRYQAVEDADTVRGLDWLQTTYFAPDTRHLARLFSAAMQRGFLLAGATSSDEDDVRAFLEENW